MKKIIYLIAVLLLIGCNDEKTVKSETVYQEYTELAYPESKGEVTDVYYTGIKIPVENINGKYVYQGDIIIPKDKSTKSPVKLVFDKGEVPQEKSTGRTSHYWEDNIVVYAINPNLPNKDRVYDALYHWRKYTNLKFVERTSERNYIYFTPGSGCSSYVGMIGGRQNINLARACTTGNTIHEIGHAVGLWHEQSRADRDNYITINYDNIRSGTRHNFDTYIQSRFDGEDLTNGLDFNSIMMYSAFSFSKNGQPTITRKDGSLYSTQRNYLSNADIEGVRSMYGGEYINFEHYTINGLTVMYFYGYWYYHAPSGLKRVELIRGNWFYI